MEHIEKLMEDYDLAIDELMEANKYARMVWKAETTERQSMFKDLAKHEMGHANSFIRSAEKTAAEDPQLSTVWHHLSRRLDRWKADIEKMLA